MTNNALFKKITLVMIQVNSITQKIDIKKTKQSYLQIG